MDLAAEVDTEPEALARIVAVARRTSTPSFCDLLWPPCPDSVDEICDDPAVMFESPRRIVVFQWVGKELRYYAGGWCPAQARRLEQDRVWAEGSEQGVFGSVAGALAFTIEYLAEERPFAAVRAPREVRYSRYPDGSEP